MRETETQTWEGKNRIMTCRLWLKLKLRCFTSAIIWSYFILLSEVQAASKHGWKCKYLNISNIEKTSIKLLIIIRETLPTKSNMKVEIAWTKNCCAVSLKYIFHSLIRDLIFPLCFFLKNCCCLVTLQLNTVCNLFEFLILVHSFIHCRLQILWAVGF